MLEFVFDSTHVNEHTIIFRDTQYTLHLSITRKNSNSQQNEDMVALRVQYPFGQLPT